MAKCKRLGGFKNITVFPKGTDGAFTAGVPLLGAISAEASMNFENIVFHADNTVDYNNYYFADGELSLTLSGLTADEYKLLFGNEVKDGMVSVKTTDISPSLAIAFETNKIEDNKRRMYVIYDVTFASPSVSLETLAGEIPESTVELTASIKPHESGEIYAFIDESETNAAVVAKWYEAPQFIAQA